jgi:uncharacterized OsmC-like protein
MTTQNAVQVENPPVNGINVNQVMNTITSAAQDTANAQFQFRTRNEWTGGSSNCTTIRDFYALGHEDDTRSQSFEIDSDQAPFLDGRNSAPTPVEYLLHSLISCLTTTLVYHASVHGIEIGSVSSRLEGDIDVRGFFGLSEEVRKGFHTMRVRMQVQSKASVEELTELAMFSPVYDVISRSLPVEVVLEKI